MSDNLPRAPHDLRAVVACSDCFKDYGLRQTALDNGRESSEVCPCCKSSTGRKLDWLTLVETCTTFFVCGSVPTGRGVFAPVIQVNDRFGASDSFGTAELNADIRLLERQHGLYCFYYGPPLWQFGKPPNEEGRVEWSVEDLDYVIQYCSERSLTAGDIVYRVQLDVRESEISPGRFCSPPDEFRTKFWRFDSEAVPICYTAFDVETCLHESRVTLQHDIFVAVLEVQRTLRLLDLSACSGAAHITPFEDPAIWLRSLLYDADESYGVCRRLAHRIRERGYSGFTYTSFFQQAAERPHKNAAFFGTPIGAGDLAALSINKVRLANIAYDWQFAPVVTGAFIGDRE